MQNSTLVIEKPNFKDYALLKNNLDLNEGVFKILGTLDFVNNTGGPLNLTLKDSQGDYIELRLNDIIFISEAILKDVVQPAVDQFSVGLSQTVDGAETKSLLITNPTNLYENGIGSYSSNIVTPANGTYLTVNTAGVTTSATVQCLLTVWRR